MDKSVDFYFDVGSPAAYLAWTQLPALCLETGATLNYRPMLLGGVFQATGNRPPISVPLKGSYLFDDLGRFALRYGVPFSLNPYFPVNTITLMRIAAGLEMQADIRLEAYIRAVFQAIQKQEGTVVVGIVTLFVFVFIIFNLLVDVLYAALDPRIRYE